MCASVVFPIASFFLLELLEPFKNIEFFYKIGIVAILGLIGLLLLLGDKWRKKHKEIKAKFEKLEAEKLEISNHMEEIKKQNFDLVTQIDVLKKENEKFSNQLSNFKDSQDKKTLEAFLRDLPPKRSAAFFRDDAFILPFLRSYIEEIYTFQNEIFRNPMKYLFHDAELKEKFEKFTDASFELLGENGVLETNLDDLGFDDKRIQFSPDKYKHTKKYNVELKKVKLSVCKYLNKYDEIQKIAHEKFGVSASSSIEN